jgi:hypothetical protein
MSAGFYRYEPDNLYYGPNFVLALDYQLYAENKDMTLCGWQAITEVDNIDQAYLEALHYIFPYLHSISTK